MNYAIRNDRERSEGERRIFSGANYMTGYTRILAALGLTVASVATAQQPPAVRALGPIERVSASALASVASAIPTHDGHVVVNDITGRRLLMFDSTLSRATIIADTAGSAPDSYGTGFGATLIRYRADTALFIDPRSLSMFVIGPAGAINRVMAVPRPDEAQALIGGLFGVPGFDARGRLVYFGGINSLPGMLMLGLGRPVPNTPEFMAHVQLNRVDSTFVVRADLTTRVLDTAASVKIPKSNRLLKLDAQGLLRSIEVTPDPLPLIDDWVVMADGSIALVRGRDYHVDWIDASGNRSSSPKMPFDWQPVTDEHKERLIDSTVTSWQSDFDKITADRKARAGAGGGAAAGTGRGGGGTGGRGGGGGSGPGARPMEIAPTVALRPALTELPDYMPPFTANAVTADADDNIWIRTTTIVNGQPVYDIVNRQGELVDRVQLPPFRTIAGFAPGHVFMAVKDSAGVVHLERARVK
jgi:hypothetical protein